MNMSKQVRTKNEDGGERYGKVPKAEALKKGAIKPSKGKKADSVKKSAKKSDESRIAWWVQFRQYLREVVYELRKVVWPSRKETIATTSVVVVIVIISGIFLGIVDFLLSRFVRLLIG